MIVNIKNDYLPIDKKMLFNEIQDEKKIENMIHHNFCRYIAQKGPKKGKMCLNNFKDINELKYCATHRYEMKPDLICSLCNNCYTKSDICKICKSFYKKPIPKFKLPPQDEKELYLLSNFNSVLIENIYPNALYTIKHYDRHKYFQDTIVKINLILPKYNENGIKIKTINKDHYIKIFNNIINILTKFKIKGEINHYNTYINDIFEKNNIYGIICFMKIFNNKFRNFTSLDKACNVPLPSVTNDEEILLNLDNLQNNNFLKKPNWEENKKHIDAHQCILKCCLCKNNEAMDICFECWDEQQSRYRYIGSFHDKSTQCNLLNTTLKCGDEIINEKGNMTYYHFINKNDNIIYKEDSNMQLIVYNDFGYEATNHYINCRLKKYIKNRKSYKKKKNKKKDKKLKQDLKEIIESNNSEIDIINEDKKVNILDMELKIIMTKYNLNIKTVYEEINNEIFIINEQREKMKTNNDLHIILTGLKSLNELFHKHIYDTLNYLIYILKQNNINDENSIYHLFINDFKYVLKFYINDYNYFTNNFKPSTCK